MIFLFWSRYKRRKEEMKASKLARRNDILANIDIITANAKKRKEEVFSLEEKPEKKENIFDFVETSDDLTSDHLTSDDITSNDCASNDALIDFESLEKYSESVTIPQNDNDNDIIDFENFEDSEIYKKLN